MAISEQRLEAMVDWPTISDVFALVQEVRAQRALLAEVREWVIGCACNAPEECDETNHLPLRIDAAIRGEVPEAH